MEDTKAWDLGSTGCYDANRNYFVEYAQEMLKNLEEAKKVNYYDWFDYARRDHTHADLQQQIDKLKQQVAELQAVTGVGGETDDERAEREIREFAAARGKKVTVEAKA